jgi:hypothetical protein
LPVAADFGGVHYKSIKRTRLTAETSEIGNPEVPLPAPARDGRDLAHEEHPCRQPSSRRSVHRATPRPRPRPRRPNAGKSSGGGGSDDRTGKVGQKVANQGTTHEVTSVQTKTQIGDSTFGAHADGTFIVANLDLTNTKDESKTFNESAAHIETADGKSYESSSGAMIQFGDDSLFLKKIQPDLTTHGKLAFDVPKSKVAGSELVIEDVYGRGEVTIDLGL